MADGYEIQMSDGRVFQLVPNDKTKPTALSHGDVKIEVSPDGTSCNLEPAPGKTFSDVAAIVGFKPASFDVKDRVDPDNTITSDFEVMRVCHVCNGWYCCISNGCVNCGCGWICDW